MQVRIPHPIVLIEETSFSVDEINSAILCVFTISLIIHFLSDGWSNLFRVVVSGNGLGQY